MIDKSESIQNLAKALLVFDAEVAKVSKTASNPFFKNKYAPLPEIQDAVKEPLLKAGLTLKQIPLGEHSLYSILIHAESGEWLGGEFIMHPAKDDPQGNGSRLTYQKRYALGAMLGINIDEDDDGNRASSVPKPKPELPKPQPDPPKPQPEADPFTMTEFDQAIAMIRKADTEAALMDIYNTFAAYRKEKEFMSELSKRKTEIKRLVA